jgi:hypothetical protein
LSKGISLVWRSKTKKEFACLPATAGLRQAGWSKWLAASLELRAKAALLPSG